MYSRAPPSLLFYYLEKLYYQEMACWNSNCCLLTGDSYSGRQLRCFPFICHICVRLQSLFLSPLACAFIFVHPKQRCLLSMIILFIDHRQCIKYLTLKQLLNFSYLTIFTKVGPCVNSYNLLLIGWLRLSQGHSLHNWTSCDVWQVSYKCRWEQSLTMTLDCKQYCLL